MSSSSSPVVLVTGANTGLGLAIVQSLLQSSNTYTVLLGSRSIERGEKAKAELLADGQFKAGIDKGSQVEVVQCDLGDEDGFQKIADFVEKKYGRLDVLVNNAGINLDWELKDGKRTTREAFANAFSTNVIDTHLLTSAVAPLLLQSQSARLIFITSGVGSCTSQVSKGSKSIDEPPAAGWPKQWTPNVLTYRTSKAAENMLALEWRRSFLNDGVKVSVVDPGLLATGLAGVGPEVVKKMGGEDPILGGNLVRSVIEGEKDEYDGKLISRGGQDVLPW